MLMDCWAWLAEISKNEIFRSGLFVFALAVTAVIVLVLLERWWEKIPKKKRILQFLIAVLVITVVIPKPLLWPQGWGIGPEKSITTTSIETVGKDAQGNPIKTVETTKHDDGKTLWDWLSLLGVPLSLAILGFWLQTLQQNRAVELAEVQKKRDESFAQEQRDRAEKLAEEQRKIAADEAKEELLQVYFDRLSVLLVDKNLLAIADKGNQATPEEQQLLDSSKNIVSARTLSILRRFENDPEPKASVIRFLIETDFISKLRLNLSRADLSTAILRFAALSGANLGGGIFRSADLRQSDLSTADLSYADFSIAKLSNADLNGANLTNANLRDAELINTNFSGADLRHADFDGAKLSSAKLMDANLVFTNFANANLTRANLTNANLTNANLTNADLNIANLTNVNLTNADLSGAHLTNVNLTNADLSGARLTDQQLERAKLCYVILPEGSRLDPERDCRELGLSNPFN
jgi:uncharacterized protein YjbI with pentapeptide repeats